MSDPHLALQDAILKALQADDGMKALVKDRVFDEPPAKPEFPYVTFGDGQTLPDKADCIDGSECFIRIDVWSRKPGYVECKAIVGAIMAVLDEGDDAIALDGHRLNTLQREDAQYLRDPDGKTRLAALTFRALTEPSV